MNQNQDNSIVEESIESFTQEYAAKLSLQDQENQKFNAPTAPLAADTKCTVLDDKLSAKIIEQIFFLLRFNDIPFSNQYWGSVVQSLYSPDLVDKLFGIIGMRKLLSVEDNPPIQQVIDSNLVPVLMQYAHQTEYPQMQFEALWALTNVASGTTAQTQVVVDHGGIPLFVQCLNSPVLSVMEQGIWAIGNLAGDNTHFRDNLIQLGTLDILVHLISQNFNSPSVTKNGVWALCNLCRGNPRPKYQLIKNAVQFCCKYIIEKSNDFNEDDYLIEIMWVLSYPDELKDDLDLETANKLVTKITPYLKSKSIGVVVPTLRLLSNLFENEAFADCFIKNRWIELLVLLLGHKKIAIRRETCFLIARLTDIHNYEVQYFIIFQIYEIFSNPLVPETLFKLFQNDEISVKIEIAYIFSNLCCHDNLAQVYNFYRISDIIKYFIKLLTTHQAKYIIIALECMQRILELGQSFHEGGLNMFVQRIEELNGVSILENLQLSPSVAVYEKALKLLEDFFSVEEEDNNEIATENNQNNSFAAGPSAPPVFSFYGSAPQNHQNSSLFG